MDSGATSLLAAFIIDFGVQFTSYAISAALKTERLYDVSACITYQACTLITLLAFRFEPLSALSFRQIMASAMILIWCTRLGVFLFARVLKVPDKRFDQFKDDPIKFMIPWSAQILWIFVTAMPVYIINGNRSSLQRPIFWSDFVGLGIYLIGFLTETIADYQKQAFKDKHPNDFCSTGLYAYSRYPNYFGEVVLHFGIWVTCTAGINEPWQWISVISPIFVFTLLVFGSGVALSEENAMKRYGNRNDYIEYRTRTSKFIPWPPKRSNGAVTNSSEN